MRELARLLHCDASAITGIVDALEDSGLVERRVDPRDRRVKYVVPTRRGIRTRLAINKKLFEWLPGVTTLPHQDRLLFRDLLARAMSHKNA
jgi:DNA-binding MarR family transcriptional regulator